MELLLGKTISELQIAATSVGLPKFTGKQLAEWLYVHRVRTFDEMTNISLKGREALKRTYSIGRHEPVTHADSVDGTKKFLFKVTISNDNKDRNTTNAIEQYIESVYIPDDDRGTLCVSTQAGCKMGCRFCMTGTLGFHGQLTAAEILNQIFEIDAIVSPDSRSGGLTNLVYMGEGEPMDNIDNVLRSLEIMTSDYGCAWSPKRITVSSVGIISGLQRFLEESECHLAISLHNPYPIERQEIMPAEKMCSIIDIVNLLKQYDWSHQRRVSFEYICWSGLNDTPRHAKELLSLLHGLTCRINLIRFHESKTEQNTRKHSTDITLNSSNERSMEWFCNYLNDNGIITTIRRSRGEDILAACGQLVNALQKQTDSFQKQH